MLQVELISANYCVFLANLVHSICLKLLRSSSHAKKNGSPDGLIFFSKESKGLAPLRRIVMSPQIRCLKLN